MSNYICNDQLTRIKNPPFGKTWTLPKTYRVGDRGVKNTLPYIIRGFATAVKRRDGKPTSVFMVVKFKAIKSWVFIGIGQTDCFREKLVFGTHRNPVFNR